MFSFTALFTLLALGHRPTIASAQRQSAGPSPFADQGLQLRSRFDDGGDRYVGWSVRPGEVLMIDGDPCEVRKLGLRATLLWRDRDNAELLIPNQTFFTSSATTYTASDRMRRSQVSVGAAYHHDPAEVIALLEATALTVPRVLRDAVYDVVARNRHRVPRECPVPTETVRRRFAERLREA